MKTITKNIPQPPGQGQGKKRDTILKEHDYSKDPIYRIETCKFQREENGEWEPGILINEGTKGILDKNGQTVPEVWDYRQRTAFCLDFQELDYWLPYFHGWLDHIGKLVFGKGSKDATDI
jgi:hypothetical protein